MNSPISMLPAYYPHEALTSGQFEPSNIVGFFNVKILHVMLLRQLVGLFGQGIGAITSIEAVYASLLVAASAMLVLLAFFLWADFHHAIALGLLSLVAPVNVYLGSKLLSETPAMFCAVASLLLLVLGLRTQRWTLFLLSVSALALTGGLLSRGTVLLLVAGGWFALWVACPPGLQRKQIMRAVGIVSIFSLGALLLSNSLFALQLLRGLGSFHTVTSMTGGGARETLKRVVIAFGPLLLALPLALASQSKRQLGVLWPLARLQRTTNALRFAVYRRAPPRDRGTGDGRTSYVRR